MVTPELNEELIYKLVVLEVAVSTTDKYDNSSLVHSAGGLNNIARGGGCGSSGRTAYVLQWQNLLINNIVQPHVCLNLIANAKFFGWLDGLPMLSQ